MFNTDLLKTVKMLVMDVDGVLTDCRIYYDTDGLWKRFYSIRDGVGIKRLAEQGYKLAVITGSEAVDVRARVKMLGIDYFYEGALDKRPAFLQLQKDSGLTPKQMAYIGDDVYDLPLLSEVAFAATVPEAVKEVVTQVHHITERPGGNGAVREICDYILQYGHYAVGKGPA